MSSPEPPPPPPRSGPPKIKWTSIDNLVITKDAADTDDDEDKPRSSTSSSAKSPPVNPTDPIVMNSLNDIVTPPIDLSQVWYSSVHGPAAHQVETALGKVIASTSPPGARITMDSPDEFERAKVWLDTATGPVLHTIENKIPNSVKACYQRRDLYKVTLKTKVIGDKEFKEEIGKRLGSFPNTQKVVPLKDGFKFEVLKGSPCPVNTKMEAWKDVDVVLLPETETSNMVKAENR